MQYVIYFEKNEYILQFCKNLTFMWKKVNVNNETRLIVVSYNIDMYFNELYNSIQ